MYDRTLILESLEQIEELIGNLLESTSTIIDMADLLKTADGMLRLNGICMSFLIVGEEFKKIDRYSDKKLLPNYPEIPWKNVMGLRDKIAHGYFEIDIDVIFDTLRNDMPPLLAVVKQMITDLRLLTN
jgi:uncharacterized protein with HEPN domain